VGWVVRYRGRSQKARERERADNEHHVAYGAGRRDDRAGEREGVLTANNLSLLCPRCLLRSGPRGSDDGKFTTNVTMRPRFRRKRGTE